MAAVAQQPRLADPELRLHNELLHITQEAFANADRLAKWDVTASRSSAKQLEDLVQQQFRKLKSLLADLTHAANEQET
jgi:hypothetical protein